MIDFSSVTPAKSQAAVSRLVLSLFPGAGLLDRGFEQAGFCVVRGFRVAKPLFPMARGVAEAIRDRGVTLGRLCECGCGRQLGHRPNQRTATAACRKRIERARSGENRKAVVSL